MAACRWFLIAPLGLLGLISCSERENSGNSKSRQLAVEAMEVKPNRLENRVETTGSIRPNEEVQLRSEVAGRVARILFSEGEQVKKGQLLVTIDNEEIKAQMERTNVQLQQALRNEKRQQQLLQAEGISEEVYEQSQLQVAQLKAEKAELQARLNNTTIRAPFNGTIGLRSISEGGYVSPGDNIANLVQTDPIKIDFSVPEVYASQLNENTTIEFTVNGIADTMSATVYAIEPRINTTSRSLAVRARASNENRNLLPGAFAEIKVNLGSRKDALLVPTSAVNTEINGKSIFIYNRGRAYRKEITTGIRTAADLEVLNGLSAGDTVILTGLLGLKDSAEVNISKLISQPGSKSLQP